MEILAWVAGPWAATEISFLLWPPTALFLIALPAIFSTKGDKRQILISTPGLVRVAIEVMLYGAAIGGAWIAWPVPVAIPATVVVAAAFAIGLPRLRWLIQGAPVSPLR